MNLVEILCTAVLTVGLFALGRYLIKRSEKKAIDREKRLHKDQEDKIVERVTNYLVKVKRFPRKEIESPVVQDAIRASANTVFSMWKGSLSGSSIFSFRGGTYTADKISGIAEEDRGKED